jgi:Cytochrome P460
LRVGDAFLKASSTMFPAGTVQSGLADIATSQGTTRIRFPAPGEISPSRPKPAPASESHASSFGVAYANEVARGSILSKEPATFPLGSILVREKLSTPTAANPEVLVVMVKREKNFNPEGNDWEFLTVSGDMKKIEKRERQGKCQQCHASEAKHDFVFPYPAQ